MKFLKEIIKSRNIIWQLAKNDCKSRFASSGLGIIWAFLQPLLNILVLWFVFQVGFRSMPVDDVPFIVWYIPAFLSWNFFSEALSQSTNSMMEYSYLLKKVNFKVEIIPLIKIVSSFIIHLFFIGFIIVINLIYGRIPTIYYLQIVYYLFCLIVFLAGAGWLLSGIAIFIKDVSNLIAVFLQIGFWITPLFWDPSTMNIVVQNILKLNPMYYICMGYREAITSDIWFWQHPAQTVYFWTITIVMYFVGTKLFVKLKPHFVDIL